jgi:membrane protease subunit HflC
VQYRIEGPVHYLFKVRESRQTIRDVAEAVMRRVVGNRLGSDVLTVGRVAVSTEVKAEMQKILSAYQTGVRLVTVELQDVTPPDAVKPAFNEVNEARQDRERTINQAQEQANREIPKAREVVPQYGIELVDVRIKRLDYVESVREKVYARMISERKRIAARFRSEGEGQSAEILGTMEKELRQIRSTAYRRVQEVRGKADAEAARVYGVAYGEDPEFYAFSRTLEAYEERQNSNSTVILTTDSDYYRYLKRSNASAANQKKL